MANPGMLSAAQAAARLDVKVETLYAYVSRGLLARVRTPSGSLFDPLDVERFALTRARTAGPPGTSRSSAPDGSPLMVIETAVALIEDDELYYRGVLARELASELTFEEAAAFVLTGERHRGVEFAGDVRAVGSAAAVVASMPGSASIRDLLQVAVTVLGAADALRATANAADVWPLAPTLIGGLVDSLPRAVALDPGPASLAGRLWSRLSPLPPDPAAIDCLNAALVLLIEHDLAVSTVAARAAASARATPYGVVATGLAALDSALHGSASRDCHGLIGSILSGEHPERALAEVARHTERGVPGFGHPLYSGWDPRARDLITRLDDLPMAGDVMEVVNTVIDIVERRTGRHPNVDLALAALGCAGGMTSSATAGIFAVARSVGWLAHATDEYTREPLRMRPVGRYVGV